MPFTDHVAVTLRLRGDLHRTLGHKLVSPKGFPQEALHPLRSDDTKDALHRRFGAPPPAWEEWTRQAEAMLLQVTGTDPKGNRGRGTAPRTVPQTIGRPQVGHTGVAGSRALIRLRLRVLRYDRLALLDTRGDTLEARHLRLLLAGTQPPTATERTILQRWQDATDRRRRRDWHNWVSAQLARSGGKLYQWAQRLGAADDLTSLQPAPEGHQQTLRSRLSDARASWLRLWDGGEPWVPQFNNPLPPITGTQVRDVVRHLRPGKAHGADGWRPQELAALPDSWLDALAGCYNQWETQGAWPEAIRTSIIALVPKAGAATEAGLRPIGLLSYIYRVWMAIRKRDLRQWSLQLHGGRHLGAAHLACLTQVDMELAHYRGFHTLFALLDCSKCYERIEHRTAGTRAHQSGCPDTALNMIMSAYSGSRLLRAHGAVALPAHGQHGLIAGCSFAKDVLKAFLRPTATRPISGKFRDYVDDMNVLAIAPTPQRAAIALSDSLTRVKQSLAADNMILNDSKEQVYGSTVHTRRAWQSHTGHEAVAVARDLGVWHFGHGQKHPVFSSVVQALRPVALRIGSLPIPRNRKALIASAIFYGKLLYGQETHALTQAQYHTLRQLMGTALGTRTARRSPDALLLHFAQGKFDPELARASRLFKFWLRELPGCCIPPAYWQVCHRDVYRGPIHTLRRLLLRYGIQSEVPHVWHVSGRAYDLHQPQGLLVAALAQVRRYLWNRLARTHSYFQGMQDGRDEDALPLLRTSDPRAQSFADVLCTHSVYTPHIAHYRWGRSPRCPGCGAEGADWAHFVDFCPSFPRGPALLPDAPSALRYTGNVPLGYLCRPESAQMRLAQVLPEVACTDTVFRVATDGGCRNTPGGARAGWGIHSDLPALCAEGAVPGPWQTAQRAEVTAVAEALGRAPGRLHILSDSRYVSDRLHTILQTQTLPPGQHSDLWSAIFAFRHKLHAITWVKAHLTLEEALGRGISAEDWRLNHQADLAATRGIGMHTEDPGALILFQHRSRIVKLWQAHLVRLYMRYRTLPKFHGSVAPGLHTRTRAQGATHMPRCVRTDLRWQAMHAITHCDQGDACVRCGRISRARRQGRLQQWRRPCAPLQVHARRLHLGHNPVWSGVWGCSACACPGNQLHKRGCHPLRRPRPSNGPSDPGPPADGDDPDDDPQGPPKRHRHTRMPAGTLSVGAQSTLSSWIRRPPAPVDPPQALARGGPL